MVHPPEAENGASIGRVVPRVGNAAAMGVEAAVGMVAEAEVAAVMVVEGAAADVEALVVPAAEEEAVAFADPVAVDDREGDEVMVVGVVEAGVTAVVAEAVGTAECPRKVTPRAADIDDFVTL